MNLYPFSYRAEKPKTSVMFLFEMPQMPR